MNRKTIWTTLVIDLAGVFFSSTLLLTHYRQLQGVHGGAICDISASLSCSDVVASPYAFIFSIPLSGIGLLFYLFVFTVLIFVLASNKTRKQSVIFIFWLSIAAVAVSIVMAVISITLIKILCPFCIGMYVVNMALALLMPFSLERKIADMKNLSQPHFWRHAVLLIVFLLGGSLILKAIDKEVITRAFAADTQNDAKKTVDLKNKTPSFTMDDILQMHFSQKPVEIELAGFYHKGNGPIVVMEFSDFECPYCRHAATYFSSAVKEYADQITFYYAPYPLDKKCNPNITREMHQHACAASAVALCAGEMGKFWEMHDIIFRSQKEINPENLIRWAEEIGLNASAMKQCIAKPAIAEKIKQGFGVASSLDVRGTPTVYMNGRKLGSWNNPQFFDTVLREEIKRRETQ